MLWCLYRGKALPLPLFDWLKAVAIVRPYDSRTGRVNHSICVTLSQNEFEDTVRSEFDDS